jgi:two-component system NtrC family sensor kinase
MNYIKNIIPVLFLLFFSTHLFGQNTVIFKGDLEILGDKIEILVDSNSNIPLEQALRSTSFKKSNKQFPNLSITSNSYWLRVNLKNLTSDQIVLNIAQPTLDQIDFYQLKGDSIVQSVKGGSKYNFNNRKDKHQSFSYPINKLNGNETSIYLYVNSGKQLNLPIYLGTDNQIQERNQFKDFLFGIYAGIIMSMLLYNLFIYTTVKDKNYIYYVIYLALVLLTQASLEGYLFRFALPEHPSLANASIYINSALLGICALEFSKRFLATKTYTPKLHKLSFIFWPIYAVIILLFFLKAYNASYLLILISAMLSALYVLFVAIKIVLKGSRSANFFLLAWSVFLVCVVVYVLKDLDILPYNTFTNTTLLLGSSLEALLISFALADKINIFKKEKEKSQEQTLKALKENERIVREQNVLLEQKVHERTEALEETNVNLNKVLANLKEAQSQLVDAEKMAGLGQLTAGIAHEINNPINFVTSNIKPLELDINELNEVITMYENVDKHGDIEEQLRAIEAFKRRIDINFVREEIKSLLSGIGDGARRTAEIIRSLKNFSRLDESDTKPVDLNEGLDSTLVLIRSNFPSYLKVVKDYTELPLVECLPGKINQVFMNLITNAVQAIKSKPNPEAEEFLHVKTWQEDHHVKISIKDSGTGMTEEVKQKIFEPFFTTKDVGEGTGLGLSIVFRIIESHRGNIEVLTNLNQGTEFIITLPLNTN